MAATDVICSVHHAARHKPGTRFTTWSAKVRNSGGALAPFPSLGGKGLVSTVVCVFNCGGIPLAPQGVQIYTRDVKMDTKCLYMVRTFIMIVIKYGLLSRHS